MEKKALELLESKAKARSLTNITTVNGFAEKTPFEDERLDFILSNNGISACKDKKVVLKECYRILKKKWPYYIYSYITKFNENNK